MAVHRHILTSACLFILFIQFVCTPSSLLAKALVQQLPEPLVPSAQIEVNIVQGDVNITLQRIDFWDGYVVFVGTGKAIGSSACIARTDFSLQLGNLQYEAANREQTRNGYGIDAPGSGFFIQCLSKQPEIVLLPFVAPVNQSDAAILYDKQLYPLSVALQSIAQESAAPLPTSTSTPTPTPTPTYTPTPTFTAAPVQKSDDSSPTFSLPLSSDVTSVFRKGEVSNHGISFTLERIDFWTKLPDDIVPNNDIFLVLTGILTYKSDGSSNHCIGAKDTILFIGEQAYEMDDMRSANQFYHSDYPGYIVPQCVSTNSSSTTFFVFDVDLIDGSMYLSVNQALLHFDESVLDLVEEASDVTGATDQASTSQNSDVLPTLTATPTEIVTQVPVTSTAKVPVQVVDETPTAVFTNTPTQLSSPTAAHTSTKMPSTPTRTATKIPTPTPTEVIVVTGTVNRNANLRAGPGTNFDIVGSATANQTIEIIGGNSEGDWLRLADGSWIAAFLVDGIVGPVPTLPPTLTPTSTATLKPTSTLSPTHTPMPTPTDDGKACGTYNSLWDGSVYEVDRWLNRNLNDPDSLEYIDWYQLTEITPDMCIVRVKFRAKNGFGGYMVADWVFLLDGQANVLGYETYEDFMN